LLESLLLKRVLPIFRQKVRPRRINLVVEELRPRGIIPALKAADLIGKDKEKALGSIWNIILATVGTKVDLDELAKAIDEKDLENIYELLEIVKTSGYHLNWGGGRRFL
jgi:hypothetical protein